MPPEPKGTILMSVRLVSMYRRMIEEKFTVKQWSAAEPLVYLSPKIVKKLGTNTNKEDDTAKLTAGKPKIAVGLANVLESRALKNKMEGKQENPGGTRNSYVIEESNWDTATPEHVKLFNFPSKGSWG